MNIINAVNCSLDINILYFFINAWSYNVFKTYSANEVDIYNAGNSVQGNQ